jgi:hypothetical protein
MDHGKWRLVTGSETCRLAKSMDGKTVAGARYGGPFRLPYTNCPRKKECSCEWEMVKPPLPAPEPVEREVPVLDPWEMEN